MDKPSHITNLLALPDSLRGLIECVGEAAALRLVEWRGGLYICVPKKVDQAHQLFDQIGAIPFAKLVEWYAGETIMLPKNDAVMRQIKHELVRHMRYGEKLPIDVIAKKTGYTMRRVFQILQEEEPHPTSGDLF